MVGLVGSAARSKETLCMFFWLFWTAYVQTFRLYYLSLVWTFKNLASMYLRRYFSNVLLTHRGSDSLDVLLGYKAE